MKQRSVLAMCASFGFVLLLVSTKITYDIESTPAEIPPVFEGVKLIDIVNPKRKHNPIDDFPLSLEPQVLQIKSGVG